MFDQFQNSFLFLIILADCADQISILIHQCIAVISHLSIRINRCIVNHKTDGSLFRCLNSITEQAIFTGISQSLLSSVLYIAFRCSQFCQFIGTGRQFCRNCEIAVHNFPLRILEQRRSKRTVNCPILFTGCRFVIPDITISILFPAIFQKQLIFSLIQCGFYSIRSPLLQHGPLHHLFRSQKRSIRCHEVCICLYQPDIGLCPVIGNISGFLRNTSFHCICPIYSRVFVNRRILMVSEADISCLTEHFFHHLSRTVCIADTAVVCNPYKKWPCHLMIFGCRSLYNHICAKWQFRRNKCPFLISKHLFYQVFIRFSTRHAGKPSPIAFRPSLHTSLINRCRTLTGKIIIIKLSDIICRPGLSVFRL